ncbi:MAG: DoxX family protein, partial [Bacteroidales bacterium]
MTEHSKLNGRDRLKETIFSIMVSPKVTNGTLLFLRCFVSFMMLTHAFAKISNFDTLLNFFPTPFGMSRAMALSMIIVIELGGSILLIFGFGSRLALLGLIAGMCTAAFFSFHPFE